jgi:hypothetical protein
MVSKSVQQYIQAGVVLLQTNDFLAIEMTTTLVLDLIFNMEAGHTCLDVWRSTLCVFAPPS